MRGQLEFLRGLWEDPRSVSAPTPSSSSLSAMIAAQADFERPGLVIELGAGTGAVTRALLERGLCPQRLVVIERTPAFVRLLKDRFAQVRVIEGDALMFDEYFPAKTAIATVVSGLPLLNLPAPARRLLIEKSLRLQGSGGRFVQLSYGGRPAVSPGNNLTVRRLRVWRNFPPAYIWTYERFLPSALGGQG